MSLKSNIEIRLISPINFILMALLNNAFYDSYETTLHLMRYKMFELERQVISYLKVTTYIVLLRMLFSKILYFIYKI